MLSSTASVMNEPGKYRIQAVAEMTGVAAATLRAWERRYGIPTPQRTKSSYRVYSDEDVALIRRLRELCEGGMAPADAARTLKQATTFQPDVVPTDQDPYTAVVEDLLDAAERFCAPDLERAAKTAMVMGPAAMVFERVFAPALTTIGRKWHSGEFSVAQEHLASHIIDSTARDMLRLASPYDGSRRAVLACFADEEHVLPLLGFGFKVASWGFSPVVLGARTPPAAIESIVSSLKPEVVALSVTMAPAGERARSLVEGYAVACARVGWLVGGAGAQELEPLVTASGGEVLTDDDPATLRARLEAAARRTSGSLTQH